MDEAIARIDPNGKDRDELEFARASLLLHGKLKPAAAPCSKEWRQMLTDILTAEPPPVGVRVPATRKTEKDTVTLLPETEVARRSSQLGVELHGVPALVPPRIVRGSSLCALAQTVVPFARIDYRQREDWCKQRRFLLPKEPVMADFDWLSVLLDESPVRVGYSPDSADWWSAHEAKHLLGLDWQQAPVSTHAQFWREADETLAALWIALRRATRHADATTLHDGTGMLEMGGGLVALIKATTVRASADERVEADFWRLPRLGEHRDPEAHPTASIIQAIGTRVAHTGAYRTRIMTEVPTQAYLAKGTSRLTITFKATAWETSGERSMQPEFGGAVAGVVGAADDARRADDDDDE